jgi:hypothetical protein
LTDVMVQVFRMMTPQQRLEQSSKITTAARAHMWRQLRIDHPNWDDWRLCRALAYLFYGDEMDAVPEEVWRRRRGKTFHSRQSKAGNGFAGNRECMGNFAHSAIYRSSFTTTNGVCCRQSVAERRGRMFQMERTYTSDRARLK